MFLTSSSGVSENCNVSLRHWHHLFLELCLQLCDCEKASVLRTRFTSLPSVCTQVDSGYENVPAVKWAADLHEQQHAFSQSLVSCRPLHVDVIWAMGWLQVDLFDSRLSWFRFYLPNSAGQNAVTSFKSAFPHHLSQLLGQLCAGFGLFVETFLKGRGTHDKKHSRSGFNEKVADEHKLDYLYKCLRSIRALLFLPSSQGNINECKTLLCRGAASNIKSSFGWI